MKREEIRNELAIVIEKLNRILSELYNRKPVRRARAKRRPMTPAMRQQIKSMLRDGSLRQSDIGAHFDISQGRISEVHRGKRK